MRLEDFTDIMNDYLFNFGVNVNDGKEKTATEWMEMFLRWSEWKTDMHNEYWRED